ncbi:MAG: DUF4188 domain-containing protein [Betaproteobacteria bacterium]|nr:DUF4188 domain-containing protein [Betaproteobacteria bacterium]MDE2151879.1 DUF4188 domain-containing protein [Betaproteobacteria bacterium]
MIHRDRLTARLEGEFAVFMIGMRINNPLQVHKWAPIVLAMPAMLKELYNQPELGLLSHEMWISRTSILVQYWRSMDALLSYAAAKNAQHLPAWQRFNRVVGVDGSVGIWHETYLAGPGRYENVYVNMPAFGMGRAGALQPARSGLQSAARRLQAADR